MIFSHATVSLMRDSPERRERETSNKRASREVVGAYGLFNRLLVCDKTYHAESPSLASPCRNIQPHVKLVSRLPQLGAQPNRATAPTLPATKPQDGDARSYRMGRFHCDSLFLA